MIMCSCLLVPFPHIPHYFNWNPKPTSSLHTSITLLPSSPPSKFGTPLEGADPSSLSPCNPLSSFHQGIGPPPSPMQESSKSKTSMLDFPSLQETGHSSLLLLVHHRFHHHPHIPTRVSCNPWGTTHFPIHTHEIPSPFHAHFSPWQLQHPMHSVYIFSSSRVLSILPPWVTKKIQPFLSQLHGCPRPRTSKKVSSFILIIHKRK